MKAGAKHIELVQLMQKFVPWSHVGIFGNERTQSTPLDPNTYFGVLNRVCVHLGSFHNYMKLDARWGELVQLMQKFVPRSHLGIFRNERTQSTYWTLNSCFGVLHSVWVHLGLFHNYMKLGAKWGELVQLMQKFVPQSHVVFFSRRTHQIHSIGP
jgi:hypothetical protein